MVQVLCIDDDPVIRSFVASRLRLEPDLNLALLAADPHEALQQLSKVTVDVLLCDYNLPGMNGMEFVEEVWNRQSTNGARLPTLFCTSWADEDFEYSASEMGAHGVLTKRDLTVELIPALRTVAKGGLWFHYEWDEGS